MCGGRLRRRYVNTAFFASRFVFAMAEEEEDLLPRRRRSSRLTGEDLARQHRQQRERMREDQLQRARRREVASMQRQMLKQMKKRQLPMGLPQKVTLRRAGVTAPVPHKREPALVRFRKPEVAEKYTACRHLYIVHRAQTRLWDLTTDALLDGGVAALCRARCSKPTSKGKEKAKKRKRSNDDCLLVNPAHVRSISLAEAQMIFFFGTPPAGVGFVPADADVGLAGAAAAGVGAGADR